MKTILVVDDEEVIRKVIFRMLSSSGYAVEVASSVREAIKLLETQHPDLVLSDFDIGAEKGCDLRDWMTKNKLSIPFVYCTGSGHKVQDSCTVLEKPFRRMELITTIQNHVGDEA